MITRAASPVSSTSTPQSVWAGRVLLSARQRQGLARLARQAWAVAGCGETFDDWRHAEVREETGRAGLTDCENRHYLLLRARWEAMLGNRLRATRDVLRQTREETTWARAQLDRACREAADVLPNAIGYAAGFLKNVRKTTLEAADPRRLRDAMFTVRRRAAQLRRQRRSGDISAPTLKEASAPSPASTGGIPAPVLAEGQTAGRNARSTEGLQASILEGGGAAAMKTRAVAGSSIRGDRGAVCARAGSIPGGASASAAGDPTKNTHLRVLSPIPDDASSRRRPQGDHP